MYNRTAGSNVLLPKNSVIEAHDGDSFEFYLDIPADCLLDSVQLYNSQGVNITDDDVYSYDNASQILSIENISSPVSVKISTTHREDMLKRYGADHF